LHFHIKWYIKFFNPKYKLNSKEILEKLNSENEEKKNQAIWECKNIIIGNPSKKKEFLKYGILKRYKIFINII
jgi:hypothetical protein